MRWPLSTVCPFALTRIPSLEMTSSLKKIQTLPSQLRSPPPSSPLTLRCRPSLTSKPSSLQCSSSTPTTSFVSTLDWGGGRIHRDQSPESSFLKGLGQLEKEPSG